MLRHRVFVLINRGVAIFVNHCGKVVWNRSKGESGQAPTYVVSA